MPASSATAREALAAEWREANPQTPEHIHAFYERSQRLADDLAAWHASEARQSMTAMLVHVARAAQATHIMDLGCGAGHDLLACAAALPSASLWGAEPNDTLRARLLSAEVARLTLNASVAETPLEQADLLICVDVLEHLPDPEAFLGAIAQRAPVGCLLFEATATFDLGTPLHLAANAGWHPGRVLERHGWQLIDYTALPGQGQRVRVWRRTASTGRQTASLLLCAYRSVSAETLQAVLGLTAGVDHGWRVRVKTGDALIARSRAIIISKWWQETNDDVLLMLDDDIVFAPADADRLIELCRAGHDVICGAYPVHNGAHLACKVAQSTVDVTFGPGHPPLEIVYAATGFMAVHRRVIDALVATMPLCHAGAAWCFYPLFQTMIRPSAEAGGYEWLSEDYGFSELARTLGFRIWLDPQTALTHLGQAGISVRNMAAMHDALEDS